MQLSCGKSLCFSVAGSLLFTCGLWPAYTESKQCSSRQYSIVEADSPGLSVCVATNSFIVPGDGLTAWPYRQYASSQIQPSVIEVNRTDRALSAGLIFITPEVFSYVVHRKVPAALIATPDGDLVWSTSSSSPGTMIINLQPQKLYGRPIITYWNGTQGHVQGYGAGAVEILNDRYERIFSICPKLDINLDTPMRAGVECFCDYHEALITSDNTILVTVYNKTRADLSSLGGPKDGYVLDSLAIEVDIETNEPVFVWSAIDHVPLSHSHRPIDQTGTVSEPYDWFHINSIQSWNGGFLINSRHTWTTYYVSREGEIQWHLNGADGGDFGTLPELTHFSWQHDARLYNHPNGHLELTYFANNEPSNVGPGSVALALSLTLPPNNITPPVLLESLFEPNNPIVAHAGGSHMELPNGNRFVGYGDRPLMREFGPAPDGGWEVRWSAKLAYTRHSYRAFKHEWHATPSARLDLVVRPVDSQNQLDHCARGSLWRGYVSWNGATDVVQYTIYVDFGNGEMSKFVTVAKLGFETEFVVPHSAVRVQVAARECLAGGEIRRSSIIVVE